MVVMYPEGQENSMLQIYKFFEDMVPHLLRFSVCNNMFTLALSLIFYCACAPAQAIAGCQSYLRFQMEATRPIAKVIPTEAIVGNLAGQPLSVISLNHFDLRSDGHNTLSLLVVVWNGGLKPQTVRKFAASLRHEERLHLRLSVLTRSNEQSDWTDDPVEQRRALEGAAQRSSSFNPDQPRYHPATSDEHVLESRWISKLRTSIESLIAQPGKQVILELLAPRSLRPTYSSEHWRIPPGGDYTGEPQVHTLASLGLIPVYRVYNATPALSILIPGGDAAYSPPLSSGGRTEQEIDEEELHQLEGGGLRPSLPEVSPMFIDLGGRNIYEASDAIPIIVNDLRQVYTVFIRNPDSCNPRVILPLQLSSTIYEAVPPINWFAPRLLSQRLLGRSALTD